MWADRKGDLLAQARALRELGDVIAVAIGQAEEAHAALAQDDPERIDAADFAPTVKVLKAIGLAVQSALSEQVRVAKHYASWSELAAAFSQSTGSVTDLVKRRPPPPLTKRIAELRDLLHDGGAGSD